jgi:hypothetical protein
VYALLESSNLGLTHPRVLTTFGLGAAALVAFLAVERRSREAMLPLELFQSRSFAGANLLTLFVYAALAGIFFFLPLNLIQVHGYTAAAAGAALLPFILLMFSLSRWSGALFDRLGPRRPLIAGCSIAGAGFALFAVPGAGGNYWTTFFPATAVLGLGMAAVVAPLTTCVMTSVSADHTGAASGVNNAVSRVAGLIAVAIFSMVMLAAFERRLERGLRELPVSELVRSEIRSQAIRLGAIQPPRNLDASRREGLRRVIAGAFVSGFRWVAAGAAGLALLGAAVAWLMIEDRARGSAPS